jgi:hypothetical protein
LIVLMTGWRGDQRASGILGGAVTLWVAIAAVIVAAFALSVSEQLFAAVAIGIAGAVILVLTMIIAVVRKSISKRSTRSYLHEERALIVEIRQALEIVERDLALPSEHSGLLDADMRTVNRLAAKIKATDGIHPFAINVADYVYNHAFRSQEPDASARTVIGAKESCDKALDGYDQLEQKHTTSGLWLKHRVRHPEPSPENAAVSRSKFRILTGTGLRIPHGEHKAIADATGSYSRDNTVPKAILSAKPEGESEMSGVATLPIAVGYQEKLALLKSQLSNFEDMPMLPHYITGDAIYQWRGHVLDWTVEARRTLTNAVDLASIHERRTHRSGRLAQDTEDAEVGLKSIRSQIGQPGESADINELRRQREKVIAAIADIVAYAAGM